MGCLDGRTPTGEIFGLGPVADFARPPKVLAADPDRRSLSKSDWVSESSRRSRTPGRRVRRGGRCHRVRLLHLEPKAEAPIRVLVLDDTQRDDEPYDNGYGHASLDEERYGWLVAELDRGQADGMLMIIAAHAPSASNPRLADGLGLERLRLGDRAARPPAQLPQSHPVDLGPSSSQPGHRVQVARPGASRARLLGDRDFVAARLPAAFRTFDIVRGDDTLSILATDVDPLVDDGSPAAMSRTYAVAAQQIVDNPLGLLPTCSYNAELVVPLSAAMQQSLAR